MIELISVSKSYPGGQQALRGVDLRVPEASTLALLGSSGCGKTTTLRLINRLIDPSSGQVRVGGRDVQSLDPIELRRGIGYVVQEAGLFPHRTALENVETVPRLLGWSASRRRRRCEELFSLAGLDFETHSDRYPNQLSGGERQRVGLARALAADPPVVLMDEPFAALDAITRSQLQQHFLDLKDELGKTMVLVTHDVDEALTLADQVALIVDGRIALIGTPDELRAAPPDSPIAAFLGDRRARS